MKKVIISCAFIVASLGGGLLLPSTNALALAACTGNGDTVVCKSAPSDITAILKSVISILLTIAGIIAVIMIVIGAIRYITSDGDPGKASTARQTVIYAIVGLVVAIMSYGIVNFVVGKL
jgi:hypothetical protein